MSEAFEEVVAVLLQAKGYWVKRNVKLQLAAAASLGLKSGACELDIIAFRHESPLEVLIIECKSFGRSGGVDWKTFDPTTGSASRRHRYKLLWSKPLQAGIVSMLQSQRVTPSGVPHVFCLASAATVRADHGRIEHYLTSNGMKFFDRAWLDTELRALGTNRIYQNCSVATLASFYHASSNARYA